VTTIVVLLCLILLALIVIERDIDTIMIFEARLCPECHGTGRIPEERDFGGQDCGACKGTGRKH
jgi:DnaJ-class molecular chaperone